MSNTYYLSRSTRSSKKWMVKTPQSKTVHFGASGYEDYTMHGDAKRKSNYIARHGKREDWNDLNTAGFWSRWLLWNKTTIRASVKDIENKFKIKIAMN